MIFKDLTMGDMDSYYGFLSQFACYSDLNFTSLITWSENVGFYLEDDVLILLMDDYSSSGKVLTGISADPDKALSLLLETQKDIQNSVVDMIPGVLIDTASDKTLAARFQESESQSDYLYSPESQLKMDGHSFSWHRRKLSQIKRSGLDFKTRAFQEARPDFQDTYQNGWKKWKQIKNELEEKALSRYLDYCSELKNQYFINITLEDKVEAFAFCELINADKKYLLIHYFKSNPKYEGLSNYLFYEIAIFAKDIGVAYLNFEQDLGEPGLRYYKQHLCPDILLEKYSLV